jgi:hypothetical protein
MRCSELLRASQPVLPPADLPPLPFRKGRAPSAVAELGSLDAVNAYFSFEHLWWLFVAASLVVSFITPSCVQTRAMKRLAAQLPPPQADQLVYINQYSSSGSTPNAAPPGPHPTSQPCSIVNISILRTSSIRWKNCPRPLQFCHSLQAL